MFKLIRILLTHGIALLVGVALGIYLLPILVQPESPSDAEVMTSFGQAVYSASLSRDLPGSDFLHWGEGEVSLSARQVSFSGAIAPGPDYRLYLTRELVLDEQSFLAVKADSAMIGRVNTFDKFILDIPQGVDPADYRALVIWCESFGEFISAAQYR